MSVSSKTNDVISQYYSSIRECLSSRDDDSIGVALRLLCGLMSRGYNLSQFAPLVAQHVINDRDEIEILAQMLMLQLASSDNDSCLQAVNSLFNAVQSPKEARRLRAIKTITNMNHPDLIQIIEAAIQKGIEDDSQYVKKAAIIGAAKLAKLSETKKNYVKKLISSSFDSSDPIVISGAIFSAELVDDGSLIVAASEKVWPIMLSLDPWSQARALHYLRQNQKAIMKSVVSVLLHSQNASVVVEASQYFLEEPELIIQPLIRLLYSPPVISVHAFVVLEKLAERHPQQLAPYASHFLPPQQSEHAEHLSVKILGHIGSHCSSDILMRWALNCGNSFAAHHLGKIGAVDCITTLLEKGQKPIAEIAAYYAAKFALEENGASTLASLLEIDGPKASVVAVFSDSCKVHHQMGEAMLEVVIDKYSSLGRDVKNEASLLASRMIDLKNSEIGRRLLNMCLSDENNDVMKRAKILDMMIKSENLKKAVWSSRDPPPPSPPVIVLPEIE